jgi:DNA-binding NarL/FixJ family response regulator
MMEQKIIIIDENKVFADTLCMALHYTGNYSGCLSFYNLEELAQQKKLVPDLLILGTCQQARINEYAEKYPAAKKILITGNQHHSDTLITLSKGQSTSIAKGSSPEKYIMVVEEVLQNKFVISSSAAKALLDNYRTTYHRAADLSLLSVREQQVLACLAQGSLNKEIAGILNISHQTVRRHCFNLYRKLNVGNRAEAVAYYLGGR